MTPIFDLAGVRAEALRIASELDDHNSNLDRKAREMIRELLAERDDWKTKHMGGFQDGHVCAARLRTLIDEIDA